MLSAAQLEVALPGRGSIASRSSVLSQVARLGQNPIPPLVGGLGVLLVRGREDDRGVQVHHRDPGQLPPGHLQPREPLRARGQQPPPVPPEPCHRRVHPGELRLAGLRQCPPHRRGRRHRPEHRPEVAQALEVADRLPTQDLGHGHVDQDLAAVIDRVEPAARHRRRQPGAQPGLLGQQPQRQRPSEPDQAIIVPDQFQPVGPRPLQPGLVARNHPVADPPGSPGDAADQRRPSGPASPYPAP